jgi:hypothetical protein
MTTHRISKKHIARLGDFTPWWAVCKKCNKQAKLTPDYARMNAKCRCANCGAIYSIALDSDHDRRMVELPLWLKSDFRGDVFWAVNGDHLLFLEHVIGASLRERPVLKGMRLKFTGAMPFNLPRWILSAKNRTDLLRTIRKLKKRLPKNFIAANPSYRIED